MLNRYELTTWRDVARVSPAQFAAMPNVGPRTVDALTGDVARRAADAAAGEQGTGRNARAAAGALGADDPVKYGDAYDLTGVAGQPLDLDALPTRAANAFRREGITRWAHLAKRSPRDLRQIPNVGQGSVAAVNAYVFRAACGRQDVPPRERGHAPVLGHAAAAAVEAMTPLELAVLLERVAGASTVRPTAVQVAARFAAEPLEVLAAEERVRAGCAAPALAEEAAVVREAVGAAAPITAAEKRARDSLPGLTGPYRAHAALAAAGYSAAHGWAFVPAAVSAAAEAWAEAHDGDPVERLFLAVVAAGVVHDHAAAWVAHRAPPGARSEDGTVRLPSSPSAADAALGFLSAAGTPARAGTVAAAVGRARQAVLRAVREDDRFVALGPGLYGVAGRDGTRPYEGVLAAVSEHLRVNGPASEHELVVRTTERFRVSGQDVLAAVRSGDGFVQEDGRWRLAADGPSPPACPTKLRVRKEPHEVPRFYRSARGGVALRLRADDALTNGAPRRLLRSVEESLCPDGAGDPVVYRWEHGAVAVRRRSGSAAASLGPLTDVIGTLGVRWGEWLVARFDTDRFAVEFSVLPDRALTPHEAVGLPAGAADGQVAHALWLPEGSARADAASVFAARGENEVVWTS